MIRGRVMCSILELMPRCNEFGMHEILVSDPNGTSHLDASVWKNEEEPEEEEEKTVGLRLSSLMRSSVEDTLNEEQRKELDQELLQSQSSGVKTLFTTDCELIVPMLAVRGKLELTTSTLSFTVSPDFEAQFKEQIAKQEAYRQSKKNEGVNKFTMLKLPENKIWRLSELTHEEYRLYSVGVGWETHG
jgi:singapore isolate B (sub-type 7) whole genome shotgun sequence assembly, scaffold_24